MRKMSRMSNLYTDDALSNLKHDYLLADIYKVMLGAEKALWSEKDNRIRYMLHLPESYTGKDLVIHRGRSREYKNNRSYNVKCFSGSARGEGIMNLELKTTKHHHKLNERMIEAITQSSNYNEYFKALDLKSAYPFSVGIACCLDDDHDFKAGAITIKEISERVPKLVGEYYNFTDFSKGLLSLYDLIESKELYDELLEFEVFEKLCDSVQALPENEDEEFSLEPLPLPPISEPPPPPKLPPSPQFSEVREAFIKHIQGDQIISNKMKDHALELLRLIDPLTYGSGLKLDVDYAKALGRPISTTQRALRQLEQSGVFKIYKEKKNKQLYREISLNMDYVKEWYKWK